MIHLFLTQGRSLLPIFISAKHFEATENVQASEIKIHVITSNEMVEPTTQQWKELKKQLEEDGFAVSDRASKVGISSNYTYEIGRQGAYLDIKLQIEQIQKQYPNDHMVIDLTGGTKIMSFAALKVASEKGLAWRYVDGLNGRIFQMSNQDSNQDVIPKPYTLPELINLEDWLRVQHGNIGSHLGDVKRYLPLWLYEWADKQLQAGNQVKAIKLPNLRHTSLDKRQLPNLYTLVLLQRTKLQMVFGIDEPNPWLTRFQKRDNKRPKDEFGSQRVVKRLSQLQRTLGADFVDCYLALPNNSQMPAVTSARNIAESLGIQVVLYQINTPFNLVIKDVERQQPSKPNADNGFAYVSLVGDEIIPSYVGFRYHEDHFRKQKNIDVGKVYLMTTRAKEQIASRWIEDEIKEKVKIKFVDETLDYNGLIEQFRSLVPNEQIGLNVTGGTTLMAIAAKEAFRDRLAYMIYAAGERVSILD
jgi:hypothetical protein